MAAKQLVFSDMVGFDFFEPFWIFEGFFSSRISSKNFGWKGIGKPPMLLSTSSACLKKGMSDDFPIYLSWGSWILRSSRSHRRNQSSQCVPLKLEDENRRNVYIFQRDLLRLEVIGRVVHFCRRVSRSSSTKAAFCFVGLCESILFCKSRKVVCVLSHLLYMFIFSHL